MNTRTASLRLPSRPGGPARQARGVVAASAVALVLLVAGLTGCGTTTTSSGATSQTSAAGQSATGATQSATGATPGACPTSNTQAFDKTRFVLHAGLAFGAFHRYLYEPFRAGSFTSGVGSRLVAIVKAAAASAFIVHEVRLVAQDAEDNPTLCKYLATPLRDFSSAVGGAVTKLRGGDTSGITSAQSSLASAESTATSQGAPITENQNAPLAA